MTATLSKMFEPFGAITSAEVIQDRESGRSKGFGFVQMGSDAEAHQTRRVGGAPNRPCGAAIRTTMKAEKTATETSTPPTRKFAAC